MGGPQHLQKTAIAFASFFGHRYLFFAAQILPGDAAGLIFNILQAARGHQLAAMHPRAGAYVHHKIRRAHGVLVVLYHNQGVAQVPQALQGGNQLGIVPLVQADAGLVQHIQHPGEGAANLGGQPDALALAARKAGRGPGQGEVAKAHALQKSQPLVYFLQHPVANQMLPFTQLQPFEKLKGLHHAFGRESADVGATHRHRQAGGVQAQAVAVGAFHPPHREGNLLAHPLAVALTEAAFQVRNHPFKVGVVAAGAKFVLPHHLQLFALGAIENGLHRLGAHLFDGGVQREAVFLAKAQVVHLAHRALGIVPAAGLDGLFPDGEALIRNNQVGVHPHEGTKAGAGFTGPKGVVEGKHAGAEFFNGDAMLWAGIALAELHLLAIHHADGHQPPGERDGRLDGIGQAGAHLLVFHKAVHHNFHGVLFVFVQGDFFFQIVDIAVHPHAGIAPPAGGLKFLLLGALPPPHHRGQHHKACPLGQF